MYSFISARLFASRVLLENAVRTDHLGAPGGKGNPAPTPRVPTVSTNARQKPLMFSTHYLSKNVL